MKKNKKGLIAIAGVLVTLIFAGISLYGFGFVQNTIYVSEGSPYDSGGIVSGQTLCEAGVNEILQEDSAGGHSVSYATQPTCLRCALADAVRLGTCYLGCSDTCPTGYNCAKPQYCDSGGCAPTGSCNGRACSCTPTDSSFWESSYRGCHAGYTLEAYYSMVVYAGDDLAKKQADYQTSCVNATPPATNQPPATLSPPETVSCGTISCTSGTVLDQASCTCKTLAQKPVIPTCTLQCGAGQILNPDTCACQSGAANSGNPVVKPYSQTPNYVMGGFGILGALISMGTTIVFLMKK